MTCCSIERRFIGDDWVFNPNLANPDGSELDLTNMTIEATYFAPSNSIPIETDVSSSTQVTNAAAGLVAVIVPNALTAAIQSLPAGRKRPLAHLQIYTIDAAGLKTTRRVIVIDPIDPATFDDRATEEGDTAVFHRTSWLGQSSIV